MKIKLLILLVFTTIFSLFLKSNYYYTQTLFPNDSLNPKFYTDTINGGNSKILDKTINKDEIIFSYQLGNKYKSPYAVESFFLSKNGFFNLLKYDSIIFLAKSKTTKFLKIQILSFDSIISNKNDLSSYRFNEGIITLDSTLSHRALSINSIKTPSWWFVRNGIPANYTKNFLNFSKTLELANAIKYDTNKVNKIVIKKIYFKGKRDWLIISGIILLIVIWIIYFLIFAKNYYKKMIEKKRNYFMNNYEKLEIIDNKEDEKNRIIDYINENYMDETLDIQKLAKEVGISKSKLTTIFKNEFKMNFKTYLNEVRLTNAEKLLITTDSSIISIAIDVGYNNVSYFNKKFKDRFNTSPLKYRKTKKSLDNS